MTRGFTLVELLVTATLLTWLATLGIGGTTQQLARLQVEAAARRLVVGIERGRNAAEVSGEGCAIQLGPNGWRGAASMGAPACEEADTVLTESFLPNEVVLASSFATALRFTANGLAIDGGTAVVGHPGTTLVRCLVVSPPLGVMRVGRYAGGVSATPSAEKCLPDPSL